MEIIVISLVFLFTSVPMAVHQSNIKHEKELLKTAEEVEQQIQTETKPELSEEK